MLISLIVVFISLDICVFNHHGEYLQYIQFLFKIKASSQGPKGHFPTGEPTADQAAFCHSLFTSGNGLCLVLVLQSQPCVWIETATVLSH